MTATGASAALDIPAYKIRQPHRIKMKGRDYSMRLSQIGGKEIVNLNTGERLGMVAEADLVIDRVTGNIVRLLVPEERHQFLLFGERNFIEIPWENVKKIGNDMIIIEQEERKKRKGFLTHG